MVKDREAWHAAVHGVRKCQRGLSNKNNQELLPPVQGLPLPTRALRLAPPPGFPLPVSWLPRCWDHTLSDPLHPLAPVPSLPAASRCASLPVARSPLCSWWSWCRWCGLLLKRVIISPSSPPTCLPLPQFTLKD